MSTHMISTHVFKHAHTHVYTHAHTHAYTHAHTHAYTHAHTHDLHTCPYTGTFTTTSTQPTRRCYHALDMHSTCIRHKLETGQKYGWARGDHSVDVW